jgi:molybdate transport system substrate-binding protein
MGRPIHPVIRFLRALSVTCGFLAAVLPEPTFAQPDAPHIAAAADLQFALPEIVDVFARRGGAPLKLSFGSSGNFARQIVQGAPFELFLAADDRYVTQVITAQRADGLGLHYATGRLALFLPQGSPIRADRDLADFAAAVNDGRLKRLALSNNRGQTPIRSSISNGHLRVAVCFAEKLEATVFGLLHLALKRRTNTHTHKHRGQS